jgi:hypothetical protein
MPLPSPESSAGAPSVLREVETLIDVFDGQSFSKKWPVMIMSLRSSKRHRCFSMFLLELSKKETTQRHAVWSKHLPGNVKRLRVRMEMLRVPCHDFFSALCSKSDDSSPMSLCRCFPECLSCMCVFLQERGKQLYDWPAACCLVRKLAGTRRMAVDEYINPTLHGLFFPSEIPLRNHLCLRALPKPSLPD